MPTYRRLAIIFRLKHRTPHTDPLDTRAVVLKLFKDIPQQDVETLLRRANALLGEWNELEAVVPSLEHEVTLSRDLSADEVTISADHWQSVVAVSSGRTVGELASALGLTELGVSRAVRDLVELGVVDVSQSERPRTTPAPREAEQTNSCSNRCASSPSSNRDCAEPESCGMRW